MHGTEPAVFVYAGGMQRPLLEAHWSHLCVISYEVPPELLTPHLPMGLELDLYEGKAYVSLVAFDFENTRVKGIAWPFFKDFPEITLRFYVRRSANSHHPAGDRGICFLKDFVPSRVVSWVARHYFNEPYEPHKMESSHHRTNTGLEVDHTLWAMGKKHTIRVAATKAPPVPIGGECRDSWFLTQDWGYSHDKDNHATRYRVAHPQWQVHKIDWCEVKFDFGLLYGEQWKFLKRKPPCSVILAEGSDVAVFPATAAN